MHALQPTARPIPTQRTGASSALPLEGPAGYAVVDVETTGLGRTDRVISAGVYRLDAEGEVVDHWYTLVNPSATRDRSGSTA